MAKEFVESAGFVVDGEAVDEGGAGVVETLKDNFGAFAAEFEDDFVEGSDGGDVPDVGLADINDHFVEHFAEVEGLGEAAGRDEEELAAHEIGAGAGGFVESGGDVDNLGNFAGEGEGAHEDADENAEGEVVGEDDHQDGGDHDHAGAFGMGAEIFEGGPVEGADGHHDHDGDESSHGDFRDPITDEDEEKHEEESGNKGGEASATAGLDVDDGLSDHGATGHATEETGDDVGDALSGTFAVFLAVGVSEVVDDGRGHEGLKQTDDGEGEGVRKDDPERFKIEGDIGEEEGGKGGGEFAHVADGAEVESGDEGKGGEDDDADQGGRDGFGEEGEEVDDGESGGDHGIHGPAGAFEFGELGEKDEDGKGVDEADGDGSGDELEEVAKLEDAGNDLEHAGEQGGGEEVLEAVVFDEVDHEQGHGPGGGGDHRGPAPNDGGDDGDAEGGVEADLGVDPGNDGEGDGFRDEGEGNNEAGEEIFVNVGEPLLLGSLPEGLHDEWVFLLKDEGMLRSWGS